MQIPSSTGTDRPREDGAPELSEREREALRHLADGRSTAQIASAMAISSNTVRTRVHRLRAKLDVVRREDVVPRARSLGLV